MSNQLISLLYDAVLRNDVCSNDVTQADIISAIENMTEAYKPRLNSLSSTEKYLADYNSVAHRCAYLHKYAAFHTAIVRDVLVSILNHDMHFFMNLYRKLTTSSLKICSLGGGPGSDIVGIVAALSQIASFQCSAKVVDLKADWEHTLWSVVHELRCKDYGLVGQCFQVENFRWEYLMADLLENKVEDDVTEAIGDADWVTMVKFVSAASCKSTETMLMKVFSMLKSGAMVLFIDNASGGFSELVSIVSKKCNMKHVFGPINHKTYTNEDLKRSFCGFTSCFSTKLTIHLMEKQGRNRESNFTVGQAGWVAIDSIPPHSRLIRESNPVEPQAEWNTGSQWVSEALLFSQAGLNREPKPLLPLPVWDREPKPLLPLPVWDGEPKPLLPLPVWERETKSLLPLPVCYREPKPLLPLPVCYREPKPLLSLPVWVGQNIPVNQWETNSIQTRWNRGKMSHCSLIKLRRQRNKSMNIGRKMKFHNNSIQMKQRAHMRL